MMQVLMEKKIIGIKENTFCLCFQWAKSDVKRFYFLKKEWNLKVNKGTIGNILLVMHACTHPHTCTVVYASLFLSPRGGGKLFNFNCTSSLGLNFKSIAVGPFLIVLVPALHRRQIWWSQVDSSKRISAYTSQLSSYLYGLIWAAYAYTHAHV